MNADVILSALRKLPQALRAATIRSPRCSHKIGFP